MKTTTCPLCEFSDVEEAWYDDVMNDENGVITVTGLRHFACPNCDTVFVDHEQSRHNLRVTQATRRIKLTR